MIQPFGTDHQGTDLRPDIPQGLVRHSDLVADNGENLFVLPPRLDQLDHGQTQSFQIDLSNPTRHTAGRHTAQVGVMSNIADESHQFTLMKNRRNGVKIHDVLAAFVRIVGDDNVTWFQVSRFETIDQLPHGDFEPG